MSTEAQKSEFAPAMSTEDFREWGKNMVDYICEYLDTIGERNVIPDVEPGYLRPMMPETAPEKPEKWPEILKDVEELIMPGITHWQHPRFHAYFPASNSFPSIMGDMLSDALGTIGFSWAASPAMAELEIVVLDWLAKLLGLPDKFTHESTGGGALQGSASDCILLSMLAARYHAIEKLREQFAQIGNTTSESAILSRLVAYSSNLAHSSVEKAGMISCVRIRQLDVDENFSLKPEALEKQITVCGTLGTTACCSFDNIKQIGVIAKRYNLWFHCDGAYGANSFICPEFRHHLAGVEMVDSFNFNPNKWLLTSFDASVFWVADKNVLTRSMVVNPVYLQHKYSDKAVDFRHWGIPLSRRFRALKLWFVIRTYGAEGLRAYIRNHVRLAKLFESFVLSEPRFEIVGSVELGLVCFRIKGSNTLTQCLLRTINESRELFVVPAMVNDLYIIRFAVCREAASNEDIQHAWNIIKHFAEQVIAAEASLKQWREHTRENSIRMRRRARAAASALELREGGTDNGKEENLNHIENSKLEKLIEDEEDLTDDDADEDEDDEENISIGSSNLGDLDTFEMDDSDIIELATERLVDLKELGAKEAYDVLAQQLKNLGVNDVKTYEECGLLNDEEIVEEEAGQINKEETLKQIDELTSPINLSPEIVNSPIAKMESDILNEEEEIAARKHRIGRFKSVSMGLALKGAERYINENLIKRVSYQNLTKNETQKEKQNPNFMSPETSFLNGSMDPCMEQKMCEDAISSTPFVSSQNDMETPRQSINGITHPMRRFSCFNPSFNQSVGGSLNGMNSGNTPVVARLVSMVMNASGNGPMNLNQSRQHRLSLKPSMLEDINKESNSCSSSSILPSVQRKGNNSYSNNWRVGMNVDDDVDDVFVCDSDLCVGSFAKESTLTRLRRQTLLKMISDPISYKNNRRNFRSLRDQRRMTTVVHDFEPQKRPKSEYIRRPTVQICENIHKAMEDETDFDEDLMRDFKRRNKSMFETSWTEKDKKPRQILPNPQLEISKKSFLKGQSGDKIQEEDEEDN